MQTLWYIQYEQQCKEAIQASTAVFKDKNEGALDKQEKNIAPEWPSQGLWS